MPDREQSKTLAKGLLLLVLLSRKKKALSLEELTKVAGLSKTVCFRLLNTLKEMHFVEQESQSKKYRLGVQNISIGAVALESLNLRQIALPFMQKLREVCNETVNLSILDGTDIVFVGRLEASHIINTHHRIGDRLSAYSTCQGKAIMAFTPSEEIEELLTQISFTKFTNNTLDSPEKLKAELGQIRKRGVAFNEQELENGLWAVAGVILDHSDLPIASLNIALPLVRHSRHDAIRKFAPMVAETCKEISRLMGCTNPPEFNIEDLIETETIIPGEK
jgi:DNA-binding IclR family transcriptional regulator